MGPNSLFVAFGMQNSDFRTRITSLYGSQTSPMVLAFVIKTATLAPELLVSMGPRPHLFVAFCNAKQRL